MAVSLKPIEEQVIVITGASSGIGLATAEAAAAKGAKVVLAARSEQTLDEIRQRLTNRGCECIAIGCDVSKRDDCQRVADEAISRFGRIDTWVNNAGLAIFGRIDQTPDEDARRLFETDFWGVVNGSMVALPHLRSKGGALINVGSEVSEAAAPLLGFYVAAKHAVKGFTDVLRIEVEEMDKAPISITLIQPTAVDTPFPQNARNLMPHEPQLPKPMIDPEQVADAILSAAEKPTRAIKVGVMAKVNTTAAKLMPGMASKMAAKKAGEMESEEPPRNPAGTLFMPGESGQAHGTGPGSQAHA